MSAVIWVSAVLALSLASAPLLHWRLRRDAKREVYRKMYRKTQPALHQLRKSFLELHVAAKSGSDALAMLADTIRRYSR